MRIDGGRIEAAEQYASAYEMQYLTKDLYGALKLHWDVIATHPKTQEAESSRTQIRKIVNDVVPAQVLLEEQVGLALAFLEEEGPAGVEAAAVTSVATNSPG